MPRNELLRRLLPTGQWVMAGAAVLIVALGALALLRGVPPVDTGSPTPSPAASGVDTSTWALFTSERFGFEVRHPANWDVYPATGPTVSGADVEWDYQVHFDRITVGAGFSGIYVISIPRPAGQTPEDWLRAHRCPCEPDLRDWETLTVDGEPARAKVTHLGEDVLSVFVFTEDRVYEFAAANFVAGDRALFDAILSTVRLHPEDASTPTPSAGSGAGT